MIKVGCMSLSYKDVFPKGELTLEDFFEAMRARRVCATIKSPCFC